ncbi:hypothetical protein NF212_24310 [Parasalinivibrio latis]|uniref:hypothetical protein n=1 Tax=Parasalinivibrio latis TaxID=2952610 RepID=UPI0030E42E81
MPNTSISVIHEKLAYIEPILQHWIECSNQYIDTWNQSDLPYWYNERANVSILAGAAWKAGWTAIEEYQVPKTDLDKTYIGRNDLYLANKELGVCAEAKVVYIDINSPEDFESYVSQSMSAAKRDVEDIQGNEDDERLAISFVVGKVKPDVDMEESINRFKRMATEFPTHAYAIYCPDAAKNLTAKDGYYYPGVAVYIEKV